MILKAVFFDLHATLAYIENPISSEEISECLLERGYEVYPQSLDTAYFVSMIDYPKHGYNSWQAYLKQVLHRLDIKMDANTLKDLAMLYQQRRTYVLFPDAASAVRKAKQLNLKTVIVTTIARFILQPAITPIHQYFDTITTGYEAGCEKSNPKMHKQTLKNKSLPKGGSDDRRRTTCRYKDSKKLSRHTILLDRGNKIFSKPCDADTKAATLIEAVAIMEKW